MKKLMITAFAIVLASATFADVYDIRFKAMTTVESTKEVNGTGVSYLKKGLVVVDGLYDDATGKYYFWTGTGAKMVPVQKAIFESQNDVDMDSPSMARALNVGFYVDGDLDTAFVAAGLGKVLTVGGDDLNSASGSFGGKYMGKPAYGTWRFSKNSSATKKGIAEYINSQSKSNLSVDSWEDNAEIKGKLDAWREVAADALKNAEEVKKQLQELAGKDAIIAEKDATIADKDAQLELIDGAFDQLNNNETVKVLEDFLKDEKAAQQGIADDAATLTNALTVAVADYKAKKEAYEESKVVNAEYKAKLEEARAAYAAAQQAKADAIAYTNYLVSVKDKSYYAPKQAEIDAQAVVVADLTATRDALINGYVAQTNAIITLDWPAYEAKLIGETNNWTTIRDNAIAAQAAAQAAYEASDFVKYTTEEGEADWSNWLKDNDLEENLANKVNFTDNVYPAMVADGKAKKLVLDTADAELAKAKKAYDAKVPGYVEILDLLAKGEADKYIEDLLAAAKDAYDYDWAVANKEVEKAQAKLDALQAEYDAAWNLKVSDAMIEEATAAIAERDAELKAAKKAAEQTAYNAWYAANKAMKTAKTTMEAAAAAIAAILGVNPETDMDATCKAEQDYIAKYAGLRDVALANVAAAEALLARMAK